MKNQKRITVIGSGGWGTALALTAYYAENQVMLWSLFKEEIDSIAAFGENKLLPGIVIPRDMGLSYKKEDIKNSDICILAVPSFAVRSTLANIKDCIDKKSIIVSVAKGFEEKNLLRLSEVIGQELPENPVAVLSGPSHAEEVARSVPTAVTVASESLECAVAVQSALSNDNFRIYTNPDVVGTELGGAIKNVIALAAGVCDGMECGDNTKAALMTRGINEMGILGRAMGARTETFAGLAGIGDLIVTCTSMHSRNRRAGILIGQGVKPDEAVKKVGTVEGYYAAKNVYNISRKYGVEMPIIEQCYNVLFNEKPPRIAISELMARPEKHEYSATWVSAEK